MPRNQVGHFYFEWYPTIFKADTQHLTLGEDGAYRRLIDHYMETRAPLPCEDKALARIIGVGWSEWEDVKPAVVKFFKPSRNPLGFLVHTFCDEMLARHEARITTAKNNGGKGGRPKGSKNKDNNPSGYENKTQQKPACSVLLDTKEVINKKESKKGKRWQRQEMPPKFLEYATEKEFAMAFITHTYEKFQNYWISKSGQDALKVDWLATWHNWLLTEIERKPHATSKQFNATQPRSNKAERAAAAVQRAAESGGFASKPTSEAETGGDATAELEFPPFIRKRPGTTGGNNCDVQPGAGGLPTAEN